MFIWSGAPNSAINFSCEMTISCNNIVDSNELSPNYVLKDIASPPVPMSVPHEKHVCLHFAWGRWILPLMSKCSICMVGDVQLNLNEFHIPHPPSAGRDCGWNKFYQMKVWFMDARFLLCVGMTTFKLMLILVATWLSSEKWHSPF